MWLITAINFYVIIILQPSQNFLGNGLIYHASGPFFNSLQPIHRHVHRRRNLLGRIHIYRVCEQDATELVHQPQRARLYNMDSMHRIGNHLLHSQEPLNSH